MVHILYGEASFKNNNNYDNMNIKISKEHGLNPSICLCPVCKKENGIALFGKLKGDIEAPKYIIGQDLCDECKKQVDDGKMFFVEVNISFTGEIIDHTGRTVIISKRAAKQILTDSQIAIGYVYVKKDDFERMFSNIIKSKENYENSKTVS